MFRSSTIIRELVLNLVEVIFTLYFNVFFKLIKVHLLVSELYVYQNAPCKNKKKSRLI